ncbi:MAG: MBL fold metallo-hydrolase [Lachnospiraceae bacterium]|nr:MBL fold metallo-hydrolase [Lachnospiraceae bacterium]
MKLTFIGAAHEVTGSCHCLSACGKTILVDCGMEQGVDVFENQELPVPASEVDYVLLTHAHIDHSGLLPLLYARGFRGEVYTTAATTDLCGIMLRDSAHIQMFEAEWRNRKAKRSGGEEYVPLYTMEDAEGVLKRFVPCGYETMIDLCEGVKICFSDVGHLLGSACIKVWIEEEDVKRSIVFSGDIGNSDQPLIKDPVLLSEADYVVMESTYGNRSHTDRPDYAADLAKILEETFLRGGNVVIPAFAVGRTQELLYFIRKIKQEKLVKSVPDFEVYVDSPLAIEATGIFNRNMAACFDEEAMELVNQGINPIRFPGLKLSVTSDDSRAINDNQTPKVIISASGMCEAGRVRHHLKHNLWRSESTVVFVGYQAVGTLGRSLLDGAESVRLFGETIEVRAQICKLDGISGHADREGLLAWLAGFEKKPVVFVVHGEDSICEEFTQNLKERGYQAEAPYSGSAYELKAGVCMLAADPVVKKGRKKKQAENTVYARLVAAGKRLMTVISHNEGGTNKDLARFADQINSLCDKWDR